MISSPASGQLGHMGEDAHGQEGRVGVRGPAPPDGYP